MSYRKKRDIAILEVLQRDWRERKRKGQLEKYLLDIEERMETEEPALYRNLQETKERFKRHPKYVRNEIIEHTLFMFEFYRRKGETNLMNYYFSTTNNNPNS